MTPRTLKMCQVPPLVVLHQPTPRYPDPPTNGEKWRCVEEPLNKGVLTEFAALLRGEWGADLPQF